MKALTTTQAIEDLNNWVDDGVPGQRSWKIQKEKRVAYTVTLNWYFGKGKVRTSQHASPYLWAAVDSCLLEFKRWERVQLEFKETQ